MRTQDNGPYTSRRLYKSHRDSIFFGVAGGLAEYFDLDPVLVRIVFVILAFASFGTVLIVYIAMAIIMPSRDEAEPDYVPLDKPPEVESGAASEGSRTLVRRNAAHVEANRRRRRQLAALILIAVGALFLIGNLGFFAWFSLGRFWPVILILIGVVLLVSRWSGRR